MELIELISRAAPNSDVTLPSGEFEGPLVINKPLRLKGKNTTIWAKRSPVIRVTSSGVSLSDIRAEITEGSTEEPALIADFMTAANNVEVLGRVSGFGAEDGYFDIPRTIELGKFPADEENSFKLEVNVPARTEIVCEMREVKFSPNVLNAGRNELTITISGISAQTFLYAQALFRSQFTRRVYLTGRPDPNAERAVLKPIYSAPKRETVSATDGYPSSEAHSPSRSGGNAGAMPQLSERAAETAAQAIREIMHGSANAAQNSTAQNAAPSTVHIPTTQNGAVPTSGQHGAHLSTMPNVNYPSQAAAPSSAATDVISMTGKQAAEPQNPNLPPLAMKRGQRVGLSQYLGSKFTVRFSANAPRGVEIDPYVFLLQAGDRAAGDEGLVFFGNSVSPNGEARYFSEDGRVEIDLSKVSSQVQKIALAYSIYDGGAAKNFRMVGSPRVALLSNGERVTFAIDALSDEATIVAMEFYRYKGEWKISAVGAGFKDGLAKLCNRYGIEVEG